MESNEKLLTAVRDLKAARRAKHEEEKKEEARLEGLELRLRAKLKHSEPQGSTPAANS